MSLSTLKTMNLNFLGSNFSWSVLKWVVAPCGAVSAAALWYHWVLSSSRKGEPPMRWSWIPWLGFALEMGKRPVELLQEGADLHGEIYGMVIGGNRMFFITDPLSTNIMFKPNKNFSWEEFHNSILHYFFGTSWKTLTSHVVCDDLMRKWYSQYLLSDSSLNVLTKRMQGYLNKQVSTLKCGQVGLLDMLSRFIFSASVATIFNEDAAAEKQLYDALMAFDKQLPIAAAGVYVDNFKDAKQGRAALMEAVQKFTQNTCELIAKRKEHFEQIGLSNHDSASLQVAIFWASVGNTMPIMFWVLYHLMASPQQMERVEEEIASVIGKFERGSVVEFRQDQLNALYFMDACITEALRLSSGSLLMRFVRHPCELTLSSGNTYTFRKGDRVGLCPPLIHYDEDIFPQAKSFHPSRWMIDSSNPSELSLAVTGKKAVFKHGKEVTGGGMLAFGGGATYCPGRRFARNEIKTLLVLLLAKYEFRATDSLKNPGFDTSRAGIGIFPPKNDVFVNVSERE